MARDVSTVNCQNLWGKQSDSGGGLEPQRNDLFLVDFSSAVNNIRKATRLELATQLPHYVRSVSFPELRTKPEVVRRDSVPYNMPSWDDLLDQVKITFLLDTHNIVDRCDVVEFLDAWMALTRAGRGSRKLGYSAPAGFLLLDSDYRVDFMFNVNIYLLRGYDSSAAGFINTNIGSSPEFERTQVKALAAFKEARKQAGLIQQGNPVAVDYSVPSSIDYETAVTYGQLAESNNDYLSVSLNLHSTYTLYNAWLGAYKISDLNHKGNELVTVEAVFYVDHVALTNSPNVAGMAQKISESE